MDWERWRRWGKLALWLSGLLTAAVALLILLFSFGLPDVKELSSFDSARVTRVLARDGQVVATLFAEKRTPVKLSQVSPDFIKALVAIEDSRFYRHHGVDPWGILRAAFANLARQGVDQGASTLTMQLARARFLSQELSYRRKIREMILAWRIESHFSKEKILEFYMNNAYFGSGAYGIESASRLYFNRSPAQLSLAQSALLAGLVQAPSQLSPLVDAAASRARMKLVLGRLLGQRQIDNAQYESALQEKLVFDPRRKVASPLLKYPYFTTYAFAQLATQLKDDQLYEGGLKISTTLDVALQRIGEEELSAALGESSWVQADNAALVLIENSSGAIRAMVGGRGWSRKNQFNRAWQAIRQPGSSFKPFVYAVALEDGRTPDSWVEDRPISFANWTPKNSDGRYRGTITLRQALRESRNAVSVRLCHESTPQRVVMLARALGITERLQPHLSIALGACEVSPLSMASAYASLARGGRSLKPYVITQVLSAQGQSLWQSPSALPVQVLSERVAGQLLEMLMGVVQSGTGSAARLEGVDVAGKTGTTDQSRDAWFVGFTPEYTLAVWVGNDDHRPMADVYGGGLPASIWRRVMARVVARGVRQPRFQGKPTSPTPQAPPPAAREPREEPFVPSEEPEPAPPPAIPWERETPQPEATPAQVAPAESPLPDRPEPTPLQETP